MTGLYFLMFFSPVALILYQLLKKRKIDRVEHAELYDVFDRHPIKPPILEVRQIYFWPTFTVTFSDKADYDYAKDHGLLERFNNQLQKRFLDNGPPAEMAVTYRWVKEGKGKMREQIGHADT